MFFNPNFSLLRAKKINGKWDIKFFSPNVPANERPKLDADGDVMLNDKKKPILEQIPLNELPEGDWRKYPESTEWGIGWLPLGGYCKIAGMVDESMDVAQMAEEPQVWEYRARSVWQRLPIIIGGVLVNFILAMVIFAGVLFTWGEETLPLQNAKYGLHFSSILIENGFQNGDNIVSIEGEPVKERSDIVQKILIDGKRKVEVSREKKTVALTLPNNFDSLILANQQTDFISIRFPFVVEEVSPGSPAEMAALQAGDSIVGINGKALFIFQDIATVLDASRKELVEIDFVRNGELRVSKVQLSETGKLGVAVRPIFHFIQTQKVEYGFFQAIPAGIKLGWGTLVSYVKQLKLVFTKEGSKQLGGFGSIGKMFPKVWDWQVFWSMTALLSVILAFMNFLPIPALDGGYVLFLIYEIITGRKPNDKFLEYAQSAGMIFLFALLLFANGNDIFKAIFK